MKNLAYFLIITLLITVSNSAALEGQTSKLSSELLQLTESENPEEFAEQHGMYIIDSSVKVTIVTTDGFPDIAERYNLKEIKKHKNLIEAVVPIEELVFLSEEEEVKYIRRPYKFWKWRK